MEDPYHFFIRRVENLLKNRFPDYEKNIRYFIGAQKPSSNLKVSEKGSSQEKMQLFIVVGALFPAYIIIHRRDELSLSEQKRIWDDTAIPLIAYAFERDCIDETVLRVNYEVNEIISLIAYQRGESIAEQIDRTKKNYISKFEEKFPQHYKSISNLLYKREFNQYYDAFRPIDESMWKFSPLPIYIDYFIKYMCDEKRYRELGYRKNLNKMKDWDIDIIAILLLHFYNALNQVMHDEVNQRLMLINKDFRAEKKDLPDYFPYDFEVWRLVLLPWVVIGVEAEFWECTDDLKWSSIWMKSIRMLAEAIEAENNSMKGKGLEKLTNSLHGYFMGKIESLREMPDFYMSFRGDYKISYEEILIFREDRQKLFKRFIDYSYSKLHKEVFL